MQMLVIERLDGADGAVVAQRHVHPSDAYEVDPGVVNFGEVLAVCRCRNAVRRSSLSGSTFLRTVFRVS